jgi:hypothetical protein
MHRFASLGHLVFAGPAEKCRRRVGRRRVFTVLFDDLAVKPWNFCRRLLFDFCGFLSQFRLRLGVFSRSFPHSQDGTSIGELSGRLHLLGKGIPANPVGGSQLFLVGIGQARL